MIDLSSFLNWLIAAIKNPYYWAFALMVIGVLGVLMVLLNKLCSKEKPKCEMTFNWGIVFGTIGFLGAFIIILPPGGSDEVKSKKDASIDLPLPKKR